MAIFLSLLIVILSLNLCEHSLVWGCECSPIHMATTWFKPIVAMKGPAILIGNPLLRQSFHPAPLLLAHEGGCYSSLCLADCHVVPLLFIGSAVCGASSRWAAGYPGRCCHSGMADSEMDAGFGQPTVVTSPAVCQFCFSALRDCGSHPPPWSNCGVERAYRRPIAASSKSG